MADTLQYTGDNNKIVNSSYLYETLQEFKTEHVDTKVDKVDGKGLSTNDYTSTEKSKLSGIATGAEVNQNAFSNVVVGSTTIAADSKTDSLTLVAGSNVTLTPDATNDKITIAATDTKYTHPSYTAKTSGLYKVTVDGSGHVSAATAVTKADITALGIFTLLCVIGALLWWRPIMYLAFDRDFAASQGIASRTASYILTVVVAITIVLAIRIMGIVLLLSLFTIPAVTANILSKSYAKITLLAATIAVCGAVGGLVASYNWEIPPGTCIIFILTVALIAAKLLSLRSKKVKNAN